MTDSITYQKSLTNAEYEDIISRIPKSFKTFYNQNEAWYRVEKSKTRHEAKCKTCQEIIPPHSTRIKVLTKLLRNNNFIDSCIYLHFQISCLLNQTWRGRDRFHSIVPPFNKKLLRVNPSNITINEADEEEWTNAGITFE